MEDNVNKEQFKIVDLVGKSKNGAIPTRIGSNSWVNDKEYDLSQFNIGFVLNRFNSWTSLQP
jgi:hypothetical protein